MTHQPIRLLIVDDSAVVRGLMVRALEAEPEILITGTAMHGQAALAALRKQPADVVMLDVEMPVMDGLKALIQIQSEFPDVHVVMVSSLTREGAGTTIRALALGAAACIAKPVARSMSESIEQLSRELVPLVRALGRSGREPRGVSGASGHPCRTRLSETAPQVLVIGASTGGPKALSQVLGNLPPQFALPTLIVQHMPPMFTAMLANHLESDSGRPCHEAVPNGVIQAGHTYVAPGNYHVLIKKRGERTVTVLRQGAHEHFCRPSVNPLFHSAAECYGSAVLAVMLTGMGNDGIEGSRSIAAQDGYVIAQDEASSVIWGMPAAVVREGLACDVLPLSSIAPAIAEICQPEAVRA